MKIVVDSRIPYISDVLSGVAELISMEGEEISPEVVRDADAMVIRTRTRCGAELLEGSKVQFVGTATIGYDHIDRDYCAARGIEVSTAAGSNRRAVLQWVGAVLARHLECCSLRPSECRLGVVGVGSIGSLVADYARLWGFEVMCSDPPREEAEGLGRAEGFYPLEELLRSCDIITLHPLLTRGGAHPSYHLIGEHEVDLMAGNAALINCSRGEVVDSGALRKAIGRGVACYIDVWEGEPKGIEPELVRGATLSTCHIAGYSRQGKANASAMVVEALACHFGLPIKGWSPSEVAKVAERNIGWEQMCEEVAHYVPLDEMDRALKSDPRTFEKLRKEYVLREEFF